MGRALAQIAGVPEPTQQPLSRLPDVPSLFAPSVNAVGSAPQAPATLIEPAPESPPIGPSGTLASPQGRAVTDPPPMIRVHGGTLPSEDLPMLDPVSHGKPRIAKQGGGVKGWLVAILVVAALFAGFLLGFVVGRAGH
jgi:hypothetical protein